MKKAANIILVGFMGSGKSAISREIARLSGYSCIDTDQLLVEQQKNSISEIFASKGEAYFRQIEHTLLEQLCRARPERTVIATGGGTPLSPANRALLAEMGYVVWLCASAEETFKRVASNSNRPLLQGPEPFETITQLMKQRQSYYEEVSDCAIETDHLTIAEIASGILHSAHYYFSALPSCSHPEQSSAT